MNLTLYFFIWPLCKEICNFESKWFDSPCNFQWERSYKTPYIHSINTVIVVLDKVGQVLEAGNQGSIEVCVF